MKWLTWKFKVLQRYELSLLYAFLAFLLFAFIWFSFMFNLSHSVLEMIFYAKSCMKGR